MKSLSTVIQETLRPHSVIRKQLRKWADKRKRNLKALRSGNVPHQDSQRLLSRILQLERCITDMAEAIGDNPDDYLSAA